MCNSPGCSLSPKLATCTLRPSKSTLPLCWAASFASAYVIPVGLPSCAIRGSLPIRESLAYRTGRERYSPNVGRWALCKVELPLYGVLRSSAVRPRGKGHARGVFPTSERVVDGGGLVDRR